MNKTNPIMNTFSECLYMPSSMPVFSQLLGSVELWKAVSQVICLPVLVLPIIGQIRLLSVP